MVWEAPSPRERAHVGITRKYQQMQRRPLIPKAELVSGIALVALCAATVFQLVRVQPSLADDGPTTVSADEVSRYSNRETRPIIRLDADRPLRGYWRGTLIVTGDLRMTGGLERDGWILEDACDARAADTLGAFVPGRRVSGWLHR